MYMDKADPQNVIKLQDCVINFLTGYQATPHTATNQIPSELLNNRRMQIRLYLLHPCQMITSETMLRQ